MGTSEEAGWQLLESISTTGHGPWQVYRLKVPGGSIVNITNCGLVFYPDPRHEWTGQRHLRI